MADYAFHALAGEYPLMPALELGRMEEGMIERGFDSLFPIVLFQGQILDGRNRFLAAKAAKVEACFIDFDGTEEEAAVFVRTANEERRHLAADWLQRRRQERVDRVAAARAQGQSQRAIADAEKVSVAQVRRDLEGAENDEKTDREDSHVRRGGAPENKPPQDKPKTTGKDGKKYPAKKPSTLCERCERIGAASCPECIAKTKRKPHKSDTPPIASDADETVIVDAEGTTVPEQAREAFLVAKQLTEICRELDSIRTRVEAIAKGPGGRLIRFDDIKQKLTDAKGNLWANRPTHVCPYCHGKAKSKPCECCKGEGWTSKLYWTAAPGNDPKAKK